MLPYFSGKSVFIGLFIGLMSLTLPILYQNLQRISTLIRGNENVSKLLLVGILSAQENKLQRNTLRSTWLKNINPKTTEYKFLIGKEVCQIHPFDRVSSYECKLWNVSFPETANETTEFKTTKPTSSQNYLFSGFTFIVKHDIFVKRLGILNDIMAHHKNHTFKVGIYDAVDGRKLTSASFLYPGDDQPLSEFSWKQTPGVLLHRGFEGEVRLRVQDPLLQHTASCELHSPHSIFHLLEVLVGPHCKLYNSQACSSVAFLFTVVDVDKLRMFIKDKEDRERQWKYKTFKLTESLLIEYDRYKDLLFLPVVDVYRNLSSKMQNFFSWALTNGDWYYLMKTDDDIFVHIERVESELLLNKSKWDIWSCFREGWHVPRSGKWRDCLDEQVYPPFPTGSGYILERSSIPIGNLGYRGEDVALGLELQKRNVLKHTGEYCQWQCGSSTIVPCNTDLHDYLEKIATKYLK